MGSVVSVVRLFLFRVQWRAKHFTESGTDLTYTLRVPAGHRIEATFSDDVEDCLPTTSGLFSLLHLLLLESALIIGTSTLTSSE